MQNLEIVIHEIIVSNIELDLTLALWINSHSSSHILIHILIEANSVRCEKNTIEAHSKANKLQQQIFATLDRSEAEHLARINNGGCRPQVGILYLELMEEIRKISRHLENINDRSGMFYEKLPNAAK